MNIYDCNGKIVNSAYDNNGNIVRSVYMSNGQLIPFGFLDTAVIVSLPSISVGAIKQGGCTDGEYIYQIQFSSSSYNAGNFIKYKISDGTYTLKSFTGTQFGHGNDMCFNPNNGHFFVCAMTSDGAILELDENLDYVATHYVLGKTGETYAVWQFDFDRNTEHYISANGGGIAVYDQNWNYLGWYQMPNHPSATAQGMCTDGDYIYRVTYNPNLIDVATIDGEYVKTITYPTSGEPESIMYNWDNGEYYVCKNTSSNLYEKVLIKN